VILADVGVRQYCMASKLENYIEEGRTRNSDEREIAARALQRMDESEQAEIDAAWEADSRPSTRRSQERAGRGGARYRSTVRPLCGAAPIPASSGKTHYDHTWPIACVLTMIAWPVSMALAVAIVRPRSGAPDAAEPEP